MASGSAGERVVTVNEVLDGHVCLDLDCLDRVYLHGYLGQLQVGGQVIQFLSHRGFKVYSAACLQQIGEAFRRRVASFAEANHIPVVALKAADRNIDVMRRYLDRAAATGRSQVAAIGVAQEPQRVFVARKRDTDPSRPPQFSFDKKDRRVTVYYFYLWDASFGPAFIKVCSWCPWPMKIWVNGHEWAKQQARKIGFCFTELSNGFASAEDPAVLQRICDALQPGTINVFFQRWLSRLPLPLGRADQDAGYWWELSMAQVEVSRTIVFAQPRHARAFFDALLADNLTLGRPDIIELVFTGRHERRGRPPKADPVYKTKVVTRGTEVTINAFWKHSRIKQYLKDGRALRIEIVLNDAYDIGCQPLVLPAGTVVVTMPGGPGHGNAAQVRQRLAAAFAPGVDTVIADFTPAAFRSSDATEPVTAPNVFRVVIARRQLADFLTRPGQQSTGRSTRAWARRQTPARPPEPE